MIPVKIHCGCGQKYAFEVDPRSGPLTSAVLCPACGADGTTAANQIIAESQPLVPPGLRVSMPMPDGPIPAPRRVPPAETRVSGLPAASVRTKRFAAVAGGSLLAVAVVAGGAMLGGAQHRKPEPPGSSTTTKTGFPRTLAELNAWYVEPPAGQNAAQSYLQGLGTLQLGAAGSPALPLLGKRKLPPLGAPLPASMKSALAALITANHSALESLAQGTDCEQCRYPVDLTRGYDALFPHLPKVKNAASLLELSALWHAEAKQAELAANAVLTGLRLARSLASEPALLSQVIRAASVSAAVGALEQTVNRTPLPAAAAKDLLKTLLEMEDYDARGEGFNRALLAERVLTLTLLATPQALLQSLSAPGVKIPADLLASTTARLQKGEKPTEEREYLERSFQQLLATRQEAFPERLRADSLIRERVTDAANKKLAIVGVFLPGLAGRTAREAECLAQLRLGATAVALEQFRAAHPQGYPAALTELTPQYLPAALADPFDGQPLRYRKAGGGYLLYSVGPDLEDNSGVRTDGKEGDLVFEVKR